MHLLTPNTRCSTWVSRRSTRPSPLTCCPTFCCIRCSTLLPSTLSGELSNRRSTHLRTVPTTSSPMSFLRGSTGVILSRRIRWGPWSQCVPSGAMTLSTTSTDTLLPPISFFPLRETSMLTHRYVSSRNPLGSLQRDQARPSGESPSRATVRREIERPTEQVY